MPRVNGYSPGFPSFESGVSGPYSGRIGVPERVLCSGSGFGVFFSRSATRAP